MPILYVNGKRRGLRVKGRARISSTRRRGRRKLPASKTGMDDRAALGWKLTAHGWAPPRKRASGRRRPTAKRRAYLARIRRNPPKGARKGKNGRWVSAKSMAALRRYNRQRRIGKLGAAHKKARGKNRRRIARHLLAAERSARRSARYARKFRRNPMAKGSKKRSKAMKAYWRRRKAAGKMGALGRTRRRKRKSKGKAKSHRARSRRSKRVGSKRRARRSKRSRSARARARRIAKLAQGQVHGVGSFRFNPGRRRRRRRSYRRNPSRRRRTHRRRYRRNPSRRRRHRRSRRRSYRRYSRRYRRNPSMTDLKSLAKQVLPVLGGFYASRIAVNGIGPMLPGVSALGSLMAPALSVGAFFVGDWIGKKFLPKSRESINIGTGAQIVESVLRAFMPANIKAMIGMSDYVQMGDYVAVGAVPPLRENFTLSDYIAVGGDGVEQELGLEEELGVEEELGNVADGYMGGLPGGTRLLAPVPTQAFVTPVPARSFTKAIPPAGTSYDASSDLYGGIFGGRFGS